MIWKKNNKVIINGWVSPAAELPPNDDTIEIMYRGKTRQNSSLIITLGFYDNNKWYDAYTGAEITGTVGAWRKYKSTK